MPETFGRYQLVDRIGTGGMAEVYRARLEVPAGEEKILVIKRILKSYSSEPEFIRLFVNEAKITLPLTHGNITSVFEFGEVEGQYFLAMEYIHGQNLGNILDRVIEAGAPLPIEASLHIACELAKGLAYAHGFTTPQGERREVVHLDVSPQNVLVSYDGAVKLTDFGIARIRASAAAKGDKIVRGKASYLAPEQVRGDPLDGRADVYGLGCVLYEMLTGRRPFEGENETDTLVKVREGMWEPPGRVREQAAPFDGLLAKAMALQPEHRFQTMAEFQVALAHELFSRAPGYGAPQLSEWMRDTFAWELAGDAGEGGGRDRLLFQLARANLDVAGRNTQELLDMKTVALPTGAVEAPAAERRKQRRNLLLLGAGAAVVGLGVVLALSAGEPPKPPPPPPTGTGQLSLNAWPSAYVVLNGERLPGQTPILKKDVPAGEHTVLFVHPELGLKKQVVVQVPGGAERTISVKLER